MVNPNHVATTLNKAGNNYFALLCGNHISSNGHFHINAVVRAFSETTVNSHLVSIIRGDLGAAFRQLNIAGSFHFI